MGASTNSDEPMTARNSEDETDTTVHLELRGTAVSGMGVGREFVTMSGYEEQFVDRLGYRPFSGTFNVDLDDPSIARREEFDTVPEIRIDSWERNGETYGAASCYAVKVQANGTVVKTAHVIVPDRTDHDETQVEILAPVKIRGALDIADGDDVTVQFVG